MITEPHTGDRLAKRLNAAATLAIVAGVIGASQWGERTYRRWWKENHPLSGPRARLGGMQTAYQAKRDYSMELAALAAALVVEFARATAMAQRAKTTHAATIEPLSSAGE